MPLSPTARPSTLADRVPADPHDPDALYAAFTGWAQDRGLALYPHQDEALMEIVSGAEAQKG